MRVFSQIGSRVGLKINKWFWLIQALAVLNSLIGATVKFASLQMVRFGFWSVQTLAVIACFVLLMAVLAYFWQKVIAKVSLSAAYLGRSLVIFWALVWARLLFGEAVGWQNLLGALVIFAGTVLVMQDE